MSQTILVTGATGTVGSETVKALSMLGARVRAGVRSVVKGENLKRLPGVELVEIDLARPESLAVAFTGVQAAFLITPLDVDQVQMAAQLVDAAGKAGVGHVVRLSVSGAEVEPGIQLGRWHREAEQHLKASGLSYTILRPSSFMQNIVNQHAASIQQEGVFYLPLDQGRVAYIDARDIGEAAASILLNPEEHAGKEYTLTGPDALTGDEIAAVLSSATGKQVAYVSVPEEAARTAMESHHLPAWMTESLLELHGICRAGYASGLTSHLQEITGKPPRTFHDFAESYKGCF